MTAPEVDLLKFLRCFPVARAIETEQDGITLLERDPRYYDFPEAVRSGLHHCQSMRLGVEQQIRFSAVAIEDPEKSCIGSGNGTIGNDDNVGLLTRSQVYF